MWRYFYEGHALIDLPIVAMGFFMVAFVAASVRAFTRATQNDPRAALPLADDDASQLAERSVP